MGYLTKLSAGTAGQPIQTTPKPPAPVAPAAPAGVPREPSKPNTVSTVETPADRESAPAPRAEAAPSVHTPPPPEPKLTVEDTAQAPDDTAARQAHEAAEAKRKAEFDAKQAEKKAAEQAELDKLAAMSDEDVIKASMRHIGDATEKITRRNMKEQVAEHIQALCKHDPTFARRTMMPGKSMVLCFQHITRKAYEYVQDEMKANGIKPDSRQEGYGADIPDDLCFQWARDYFDAPVEQDEENFVPRPYVPKSGKKPAPKKAEKAKKEPKPKPAPKPKESPGVDGQISLLGEVG